ncbi:hypothetical protein BaRGS_00029077 [Batillaria attramentaria]|uniref:Uncharacterized protein n=1 Tax=Batillaria attramentaria TaxID=370345 RepID=A0ABD0JYI7_9CAEN
MYSKRSTDEHVGLCSVKSVHQLRLFWVVFHATVSGLQTVEMIIIICYCLPPAFKEPKRAQPQVNAPIQKTLKVRPLFTLNGIPLGLEEGKGGKLHHSLFTQNPMGLRKDSPARGQPEVGTRAPRASQLKLERDDRIPQLDAQRHRTRRIPTLQALPAITVLCTLLDVPRPHWQTNEGTLLPLHTIGSCLPCHPPEAGKHKLDDAGYEIRRQKKSGTMSINATRHEHTPVTPDEVHRAKSVRGNLSVHCGHKYSDTCRVETFFPLVTFVRIWSFLSQES